MSRARDSTAPPPAGRDRRADREPRDDQHDTIVPPFDVEQFAHDSESKIRSARAPALAGELTLERVRILFDDGAYEEALRLTEATLVAVPLHDEAREWATRCRGALEQTYFTNIGSLASVPTVAVHARELRAFGLDHATGFVVSQIDGVTNVETLLDVCGMPRGVALRILSDLAVRGIVTFR